MAANGNYYHIKGRDLIRVTAFLGVLGKPFLMPWAAKLERQAWVEGEGEISGPYAYQDYMEETSDWGHIIHTSVENYMRGKKPPPKLKKAHKKCLRSFLEWWDDAGYEVLDIEKTVWCLELGCAGTLDLRAKSLKTVYKEAGRGKTKRKVLVREKGKIYILDWKTGKGIWSENHLQNVTYQHLAKVRGLKNDGGVLIHIPHDGSPPVEVPVNPKATMKEIKYALHLYNWLQENR